MVNGNGNNRVSTERAVIGVLALQGDFEAHREAIERSGGKAVEVRRGKDLPQLDGLIIPGGESTTMLKLLQVEKLFEPIRQFGEEKPIFGTCAGAILLASDVQNPQQESLGLMDMMIQRNGYGRQVDSRIAQIELDGNAAEAVFIRAPVIQRVGGSVSVLASYLEHPVLVEQGRHMAATFHPELSRENRVHRRFIEKVTSARETQR